MTPHHRRTPIDRPHAVPPGPGEPDAVRQPEPPDGETLAGRGSGGDGEERDTPASSSARAWRPRPATPQELDDARTVLVLHRLDPRTGGCAACAADCPCPPALAAGRALAEAGAWNTMPFTNPTGSPAGRAATADGTGWVARLVRRLPWAAKAE